MKLFIATHNDDETLWGAMTIQRERPTVVIVFDSYVQVARGFEACHVDARREESCNALAELGVEPPEFLGFSDLDDDPNLKTRVTEALRGMFKDAEQVWAPAFELRGHDQHNLVANACQAAFGARIQNRYLSYVRGKGKTRSNHPVELRPEWVAPKLRALTQYTTQLTIPELGCWPHFAEGLQEYYVD